MTQRDNPWIDYPDWPVSTGKPPHHLTLEDLRRWIWVCTYGFWAKGSHCIFAADDGSKNPPNRFAPHWSTLLLDYPTEDIIFPDGYGTNPTPAFKEPYIGPGERLCYYDGSFSHTFVRTTDKEFVFELTELTRYGLYNQNGGESRRGTLLKYQDEDTEETWSVEQDDFRKGTPFTVKDGPAENWGFYRVRSATIKEDGENGDRLFVEVDDNNYKQQELYEAEVSGTAECDFGGDWYIFRGANGNAPYPQSIVSQEEEYETNIFFQGHADYTYQGQAKGEWWTEKDMYHRYQGNARGPNDGRPPDGGQQSVNMNADWVRAVNPNLYHSYDQNAHRYFVNYEWSYTRPGYYAIELFEITKNEVYQGWDLLPIQVDPKEQVSPFFFDDSKRAHWKYGPKVRIAAKQITEPASLGVKVACTGSATPASYGQSAVGTSTDDQYPKTNDLAMAYQNAIESACSYHTWWWPVDDDYKRNWIWKHWNVTLPEIHQTVKFGDYDNERTYWSVYQSSGLSVAYDGLINPDQPVYADMKDECWGENGSAFELCLKLGGEYDWYYDDQTPYFPKWLNDQKYVWYENEVFFDNPDSYPKGTYNGVVCDADDYGERLVQIREACWPIPKGTWRRTWKNSLGRPQGRQMVSKEHGDFLDEDSAPWKWWQEDGLAINLRYVSRCVISTANDPGYSVFYSWSETASKITDTTFSVSGDKTERLRPGAKIYLKVEDVDAEMVNILKSSYDANLEVTTITIDTEITEEVETVMLRGDEDITERHDPVYIDRGASVFIRNIPSIINACRKVLEKLKYKTVYLPTGHRGHLRTMTDGWQEEKITSYNWARLNQLFDDVCAEVNEEIETTPPWEFNGATNYGSMQLVTVWGQKQWGHYRIEDYGEHPTLPSSMGGATAYRTAHTFYISGSAALFDSYLSDESGRQFLFFISVVTSAASFYDDRQDILKASRSVTVFDKYIPAAPAIPDIPIYTMLSLSTASGIKHLVEDPWWGDQWFYYFPFKPVRRPEDDISYAGHQDYYDPAYQSDNPSGEYRYAGFYWSGLMTGRTDCAVTIRPLANNEHLVECDFSRFTDRIWYRTRERADWRFYDTFNKKDKNPPVTKNKWIEEPIIIDNNYRPTRGYGGDDRYQTYPVEYRIQAEAKLMEDLEGNGVEYIFDFDHETKETEADVFDRVQNSRHYDVEIGDDEDGWDAVDNLMMEWDVILNSKDKYSANKPLEDDNYGIPLSAVKIKLSDDLPMFPVKPRAYIEKVQDENDVWYDHIWTDVPWVDEDKEPLEYRFEWESGAGGSEGYSGQFTVIHDFDDGVQTAPTAKQGSPAFPQGANHFYVSDEVDPAVDEYTEHVYKIIYRNSEELTGNYSDELQ